jgi:hypothetical protein
VKDIEGFVAALGDMAVERDPVLVRQRSRDMTGAFSPVMKRELRDKTADLIVVPRDRDEVIKVAAAAARHRMPLIARGAGTANFGQGIPLHGGAVVDMTSLQKILWQKGPVIRAEPGIRLMEIDNATRPAGWELRMHPSTKRTATLGGFIGGGHAGVGSCVWGILRDRGNIIGIEVVSVEETPRVVELRGPEVNLVHHAYGTNGLITAIEMPLAPAWPWAEAIVLFDDFMASVEFSRALATSDGIIKKLISIDGWPLPGMMRPLAPFIRADRHMVLCMIAAPFEESFRALVADFAGDISSYCAEGEGGYGAPLYEFAWGHARFHVNKTDRSIVSGVGLFPAGENVEAIGRSYRRFEKLGPLHLEVKRFDGGLAMQGSPFFPYVDEAHLADVLRGMAEDGAMVANNHTFRVREGGMKTVDDADHVFKRAMDPYDLLNPGKMSADEERQPDSAGAALPAEGWSYQQAGLRVA